MAGFTIVEVLVASLIITIAGLGLALMFSTGQALIQEEGQTRTALRLAQQRIEEVRATKVSPTNPPDQPHQQEEFPDFVQIPFPPGYERRTKITRVCANDFTNETCPGVDPVWLVSVDVRQAGDSRARCEEPRFLCVSLASVTTGP
ncbi:MAG: hypothetical protein L0027_11030 [Candidatus Rokubacteria bacterium]|nr:hypothetical protein [Candidatus Rokubacteria bacterium]